jgi:hypothetical protein
VRKLQIRSDLRRLRAATECEVDLVRKRPDHGNGSDLGYRNIRRANTVAPSGATVESALAAGRRLNPALRAAALDTSAAAAKAAGADALDDPMISDSYQYYRNPNVFSGHAKILHSLTEGEAGRDERP